MVWNVRRVVTGHERNGKSAFLMDGHAPNIKEMASMPGLALTDLWETGGAPADNAGAADAAARPIRLEPPPGGSILRIVEFPPDAAWRGNVDSLAAFNSIGAGHAKDQSSGAATVACRAVQGCGVRRQPSCRVDHASVAPGAAWCPAATRWQPPPHPQLPSGEQSLHARIDDRHRTGPAC